MKIEYLAYGPNNRLLCVVNDGDLHNSRVFTGSGGSALREVPLERPRAIVRFRDGGTTDIYTTLGRLHVPASRRTPAGPSMERNAVAFGDDRFTLIPTEGFSVAVEESSGLLTVSENA